MDVTSSPILTSTVTSYLQGLNYSNLWSIVRVYNIAIHIGIQSSRHCKSVLSREQAYSVLLIKYKSGPTIAVASIEPMQHLSIHNHFQFC